jgi:hypothetical protein
MKIRGKAILKARRLIFFLQLLCGFSPGRKIILWSIIFQKDAREQVQSAKGFPLKPLIEIGSPQGGRKNSGFNRFARDKERRLLKVAKDARKESVCLWTPVSDFGIITVG